MLHCCESEEGLVLCEVNVKGGFFELKAMEKKIREKAKAKGERKM